MLTALLEMTVKDIKIRPILQAMLVPLQGVAIFMVNLLAHLQIKSQFIKRVICSHTFRTLDLKDLYFIFLIGVSIFLSIWKPWGLVYLLAFINSWCHDTVVITGTNIAFINFKQWFTYILYTGHAQGEHTNPKQVVSRLVFKPTALVLPGGSSNPLASVLPPI